MKDLRVVRTARSTSRRWTLAGTRISRRAGKRPILTGAAVGLIRKLGIYTAADMRGAECRSSMGGLWGRGSILLITNPVMSSRNQLRQLPLKPSLPNTSSWNTSHKEQSRGFPPPSTPPHHSQGTFREGTEITPEQCSDRRRRSCCGRWLRLRRCGGVGGDYMGPLVYIMKMNLNQEKTVHVIRDNCACDE